MPRSARAVAARSTAAAAGLLLLTSLSGVGAGLLPGLVSPAAASVGTSATDPAAGPLAGATFYRDPGSVAAVAAGALRTTDSLTAARYDRLAAPHADWFGDWVPVEQVEQAVAVRARAARQAGAVPVVVAYAIPQRDCGGYSAGGAGTPEGYTRWIDGLARGLAGGRAAVVLEPDALAMLDCLPAAAQEVRLGLLRGAVTRLATGGQVAVYLDAGHSRWVPAATMADRLARAGVAGARGFSLNVSNYGLLPDELRYGDDLSARGAGHFVVDTSRDGNGPAADGGWCNAAGRALGRTASTATGDPAADALLWVKVPGESDGQCGHGDPPAGTWSPALALALAGTAAPSGAVNFEGGSSGGWGATWGSALRVSAGATPAWSGSTGLGVTATGAGYGAVGTTTNLAGAAPGSRVTLQVYAPQGVRASVAPYVFDGAWRPRVLPAQTLRVGWQTVSFLVPSVGRVAGLGLQVNDADGWTGQLVLDQMKVAPALVLGTSSR